MQEFDHTNEHEIFLDSAVNELQKINKQLAKLILRKEELNKEIIGALGHEKEGQKTYEYASWKIEIKTPYVYSLNKKLYESGEIKLLDSYNPIKESISYSIDKKLCEQYMESAPKKVRDMLISLIDKKPGKATVSLRERC